VSKTGQPTQPEEAFRHVIRHRSMLMAYVRAIVRDPELAEDSLGDVSLVIAREWSRYGQSRPVGPWARGVARNVALSNLRKRGRRPVLLDADVLEAVAVELDSHAERGEAEKRKEALHHCVEGLSDFNRQLVQLRYSEKGLDTIKPKQWLSEVSLGTIDRLGSITKQGGARPRFILGQVILHVLRRDAQMRMWYGRIKRRRGSKIARVAVMRRLATVIWQMVKHHEPYVTGGPPRRKLPAKAA